LLQQVHIEVSFSATPGLTQVVEAEDISAWGVKRGRRSMAEGWRIKCSGIFHTLYLSIMKPHFGGFWGKSGNQNGHFL